MMLFELNKESVALLIEGSKKAIPFNIILASLLAFDLRYNQMPLLLVGCWFSAIIIISLVRWFFCRRIIKNKLTEEKRPYILLKFLALTLFMGIAWGSCYFISLPYLTELHEFIIILVFGGMCAGSIASLSIYLPAYYAYILPMFLPVIIYNYSLLNVDRTILATMFFLFVVMLLISAKINKKLLDKTFQLSHKLQVISVTDSLTGLYNRRHFEDMLPKEINRAKRDKYPLNLISMDVDNFKLINDNFGHPYGDKFLMNTGTLLTHVCHRANDTLFRLGGDEFAVILANQSLEEAISMCQLINTQFIQIRNPEYNHLKEPSILSKVTLSIGIVNIHFESPSNIEQIINVVDTALYQAKRKGKNQIIFKELT